MQHICPKCQGPTYPMTPPLGNSQVHDRACRSCGNVYTFDPEVVDRKKSNSDFHLKAVKARGKKRPDGDSGEA